MKKKLERKLHLQVQLVWIKIRKKYMIILAIYAEE